MIWFHIIFITINSKAVCVMQSYISLRQLTLTFFLLLGLAWPTHVKMMLVLQYKHIQLNNTRWYINHNIVTSLFLITLPHCVCEKHWLRHYYCCIGYSGVTWGKTESTGTHDRENQHCISSQHQMVHHQQAVSLATVLDSMLAFSSLYPAWVIFTPEHMHHLFVRLIQPNIPVIVYISMTKFVKRNHVECFF